MVAIVSASQAASSQLLRTNNEITHVYLASGSCLPLRPLQELVDYLADRPRTDFIESATTEDVPAKTDISDALSKDLKKRGMSFVGSTIIYAYMQAVGLVNDHARTCWRHGA